MSVVHRNRDGSWSSCDDSTCPEPYHVQGMTLAEVELIPLSSLLPVFEILDPPSHTTVDGDKYWHQPGSKILHREYDLPAVVATDGSLEWYEDNQYHRAGGNPALIWPNGRREWWIRGQMHRDAGPALIDEQGHTWWYQHSEITGYGPDNNPRSYTQ